MYIQLNAIDLKREEEISRSHAYGERDVERRARVVTAPDAAAPTYAVAVNFTDVRKFHPRKGGKGGTEITYTDGTKEIVAETSLEIWAKLNGLKS